MKAKVLKDFRDRHNNRLNTKGDTINISQERYDELQPMGFVKEAPGTAKVTPKKVKGKENIKLETLNKK